MTEKDYIQQNSNRKEKKESILRHILKIKDELIQLPEDFVSADRIDGGSSCETITLDDEFTPRNEGNICECHRENFSDDSLEHSGSSIGEINVKNVIDQKSQRSNLEGTSTTTSLKVAGEKSFKKPSMIPKLSRNCKLRYNDKTNANEQKFFYKSSILDESRKCENVKTNVKITKSSSSNVTSSKADAHPVKLTSLQQKLKATTSIIKQKMEYGNPKDFNNLKDTYITNRNKPRLFLQSNSSSALIGQEKPQSSLGALYKNVIQIRETALALSKRDNFKNQKSCIEKLFRNISEIQSIADKLAEVERKMQFAG